MNLFDSWKVVILPVKQKHFFYSSLPVTIWHICVIISGHSSVTSSNLHVWRYTCTTQQSTQNTDDAFNDNFVFHIHLIHVRTLLEFPNHEIRDNCNEHIKYGFDLLIISVWNSDIEMIITNIDLDKGYCKKKYDRFQRI